MEQQRRKRFKTHTNFKDVVEFHQKFGLETPDKPTLSACVPVEMIGRFEMIIEELMETMRATRHAYDPRFGQGEAESLTKIADGLIDLVYFAMGTADMLGIPWEPLWDEVQATNMRKQRAKSPAESKRLNVLDVVKPAGWVGPDEAMLAIVQQAMLRGNHSL